MVERCVGDNSSRVYPVEERKEHLCLTESLLLLKYTRPITDFIAIQFHDIWHIVNLLSIFCVQKYVLASKICISVLFPLFALKTKEQICECCLVFGRAVWYCTLSLQSLCSHCLFLYILNYFWNCILILIFLSDIMKIRHKNRCSLIILTRTATLVTPPTGSVAWTGS